MGRLSGLGALLLSLSYTRAGHPNAIPGAIPDHHPPFDLRDDTSIAEYGRISAAQKLSIQAISCASASASIIAALVTSYWFLRMERRFRHKLIMLLIFGDLLRALWYLIFASVSLVNGTIPTYSVLCQISGWCIQVGVEISDYSVLAIAVHSGMQIFNSHKCFGRDGLARYRHYVYAIVLGMPVFMASLAFIMSSNAYLSQGAFCSLPIRPFWYRLLLAWVPRYLIAITIVALAIAIYSHVGVQLAEFATTQEMSTRNASMHLDGNEKLVNPLTVTRADSMPMIGTTSPPSGITNFAGFAGFSRTSTSHNTQPSVVNASEKTLMASPTVQGVLSKSGTKKRVPPGRLEDLPPAVFVTGGSMTPMTPTSPKSHSTPPTPSSPRRPSVAFSFAESSHSARRPSVAFSVAESSSSKGEIEGKRGLSIIPAEPEPDEVPSPPADRHRSAASGLTERTLDSRDSKVDSGIGGGKSKRRMQKGTDAHSVRDREGRETRRQLRYMFIYPIVYVLMWTTPAVNQIFSYTTRYAVSPPFILTLLATLCVSSMGFVDCIIFCIRERPWRKIPGSDGSLFGSFSKTAAVSHKLSLRSAEEGQAQGDTEHGRLGSAGANDTRNLCCLPCCPSTCGGGRSEREMAARELAQARLKAEIQDRRKTMVADPDRRASIFSSVSSVSHFRAYEQDLDGIDDEDEGEDVAPDDVRPTLAAMLKEDAPRPAPREEGRRTSFPVGDLGWRRLSRLDVVPWMRMSRSNSHPAPDTAAGERVQPRRGSKSLSPHPPRADAQATTTAIRRTS